MFAEADMCPRLLGDFLKVTPAFTLVLNHVMYEGAGHRCFPAVSLGSSVAHYLNVLIVAAMFFLAAMALVADLMLGGAVSGGRRGVLGNLHCFSIRDIGHSHRKVLLGDAGEYWEPKRREQDTVKGSFPLNQ